MDRDGVYGSGMEEEGGYDTSLKYQPSSENYALVKLSNTLCSPLCEASCAHCAIRGRAKK